MNKIAKGAIATGVGIVLLAGGGGTLAVWNQAQTASPGSVVAGNLNLEAGTGVWKNAAGTTVNILTYKVVPGDTLTFSQPLTVTLLGDLMTADIAASNVTGDAFGTSASVSATTLTRINTHGTPADTSDDTVETVPATGLTPADSGLVTASTTFTFKTSTSGRTAVNATHSLGTVGYVLTQVAPATANNQ